MKFFIILAVVLSSNIFATDVENNKCKIEAHTAAYNDYISRNADAMASTKTKFKPIIEDNKITYVIQILDIERGPDQMYSVTLVKNNCKVLSID
jgi:hypothetical protein